MPSSSVRIFIVLLSGLTMLSGVLALRVSAQSATPETVSGSATLTLVERGGDISLIDQGEPGPSVGDLTVWGPNPLYNADNTSDTGATTQGTCVTLHVADSCLANETIIFPDGSTLQIQGVELADGSSLRTVIGGSGRYLGATGTVTVTPSADQSLWTKTIEIAPPPGRP